MKGGDSVKNSNHWRTSKQKLKSSMKIIRKLPDVQRPPTKAEFKRQVEGDGKYIKIVESRPRPMHLAPGKWPRTKKKPKANSEDPTQKKISKASKKRIENTRRVLEMFEHGYSTRQIVEATGLKLGSVEKYIRDEKGVQRKPNRLHDEEIIKMYDEGFKIKEMSKKLNTPDYYVKNVIKRLRAEGKVGWRSKRWEKKSWE